MHAYILAPPPPRAPLQGKGDCGAGYDGAGQAGGDRAQRAQASLYKILDSRAGRGIPKMPVD